MTVYIEYIFLDNAAISALILYLVALAAKRKVIWWRILLSACLGGLFSSLYPFLKYINYVIKIVLGTVMTIIAFKHKDFRAYLINLTLFYAVSCALAGIVLMMSSFKLVDISQYNGRLQLFPFCISLSALLLIVLTKFAVVGIYKRRTIASELCEVIISTKKGNIKATAFYDSGNKLYDDDFLPVVIVDRKLFSIIDDGSHGTVAARTVSGIKLLTTAKISFTLKRNEQVIQAVAAVSENLSEEYEMILHNEMRGGK